MNVIDNIVLWSIVLSLLAPLVFMPFGWVKKGDLRKYIKDILIAYVWFALYGLVRLCM